MIRRPDFISCWCLFLNNLSVAEYQDLADSLDSVGLPWKLNPGDGAFYGPKIDITLQVGGVHFFRILVDNFMKSENCERHRNLTCLFQFFFLLCVQLYRFRILNFGSFFHLTYFGPLEFALWRLFSLWVDDLRVESYLVGQFFPKLWIRSYWYCFAENVRKLLFRLRLRFRHTMWRLQKNIDPIVMLVRRYPSESVTRWKIWYFIWSRRVRMLWSGSTSAPPSSSTSTCPAGTLVKISVILAPFRYWPLKYRT